MKAAFTEGDWKSDTLRAGVYCNGEVIADICSGKAEGDTELIADAPKMLALLVKILMYGLKEETYGTIADLVAKHYLP